MKNKTALTVQNLSVSLDRHSVVEDISFSVPVGSSTAIIGPNGAGKSVLLKAILHLLPLQTGSVSIFGHDHSRYVKVAPYISYIPQHFNLDHFFPLTVQGLFSLKAKRPLGLGSRDRQRMLSLLEFVGAAPLLHQRLATLSGGQLQRVLLAYSLMDQPKILFLDEPAAGIDTQGQETIYHLLRRLQQAEHLTVVMVSHELQIVMNYADQVLCLNKKLVCVGHPEQVLTPETLREMYGPDIGHFHHQHGG